MAKSHAQAEFLNDVLIKNNPAVFYLLSKRGKNIFFPKKGIISQTKEAKKTELNATIGTAYEEDGSPMRLLSIDKNINIAPENIFPYASSYGKEELRLAWQKNIKKKSPSLKSNISTPIITCGATHALHIAGYLFIDPNDPIIMPDLFWVNYRLIFENTFRARINIFNTFRNTGFDISSFAEKLSSSNAEKIIIVLNFPNNPSGYTPTTNEAEKIIKLLEHHAKKGKKILVVLDDAYFGLVYEKAIFKESLFSCLTSLHKNLLAVKVDAATKEEYVWGFRVGFITFGGKGLTNETYRSLEDKAAGAVRATISNAPNISQSLILNSLASPKHKKEKNEKYKILKSRYKKVKTVLEKNKKFSKYFEPLPFNSGYFMCIKLKQNIDADIIRLKLIKKYDTGVISTGQFIRIAYSSLKKKYIENIFENIYLACNEIKI